MTIAPGRPTVVAGAIRETADLREPLMFAVERVARRIIRARMARCDQDYPPHSINRIKLTDEIIRKFALQDRPE